MDKENSLHHLSNGGASAPIQEAIGADVYERYNCNLGSAIIQSLYGTIFEK